MMNLTFGNGSDGRALTLATIQHNPETTAVV